MLNLFSSRETYRVHGAAHPSSLKARALALRMERIVLEEQALAAKRTKFMAGEPPSAHAKAGAARPVIRDARASDDPAASLPVLQWRGDLVYFAGDDRGYRTLAEALAAWRGRAA